MLNLADVESCLVPIHLQFGLWAYPPRPDSLCLAMSAFTDRQL